ncbi:putative receptor protein kinase ZmPK1 [Quercus robur]|uniref:putative receptor protein kinase ZmPK1 n=1 Tax=Quercus robur TaxID=38942 RepID=UPI0021635D7A|nr:putative receptor protein kinase ZmPK1 [Quercus robur]
MGSPPFFLLLSFVFSFPLSASTIVVISRFSTGTSLFVEKPDILISPNRDFSAGFYSVGDNAYCFAIWFSNSRTVVWMANRDNPVNGKHSKLSLFDTGNLILTDATKLNVTVWATNTVSLSSVQLFLNDTGNLVLWDKEGIVLWQSFDFPTDTLLPQQLLTRKTKLVSSRSQTNFSSGFYELSFNNDNLLRFVYNGLDVSDIYWFYSGLEDYNNSILVFNSLGNLSPSDDFTIMSADYGAMLHRRLTLDYDGNIRLYGWEEERQSWVVSWQAIQRPCIIAGACGANSFCSYVTGYGRKCSCPSGYKMKNRSDWADGCELEVELSCKENESGFLMLSHVDFYSYYGNDFGNFLNYTFDQCRDLCLAACDCIAFEYNFNKEAGYSKCYPKTRLLNGYRSPELNGDVYLKLPKSYLLSHHNPLEEFNLNCSGDGTLQSGKNSTEKFMLWFACGVGGLEIISFFLAWFLLIKTQKSLGVAKQAYDRAAIGFRKFTYTELKKATKSFSEEIGRGAGGIVYKGVLSDNRVAAIKHLNEASQGEGEFLAEVTIIGRINHMNLIEMWGYCAEGKHRLLVYEYMEHGSLADNLSINVLDWEKRFKIIMGTAKGLAYLHEDCLDWILHCDVKPQNILLNSTYQPKVADFGLSKLQNRDVLKNSSFSKIRGTRGYMAPEWVFNLPITSKVDVYSYGIVVLEMVTRKDPSRSVHAINDGGVAEHKRLFTLVREKMNKVAANTSLLEEIIDPMLEGKYDIFEMEALVQVALQCVEEDKDERPTMSQVVEMLLRQEKVNDVVIFDECSDECSLMAY